MSEEMMNGNVETQELIEPEIDEGVEGQEPTEPVVVEEPKKRTADAAFAEMRRQKEAAEKELAEFRAAQEARNTALERLTGSKEADLDALAEQMGVNKEDLLGTLEAETESAKLKMDNEQLRKRLDEVEADKKLSETVMELKAIDPDLKDISQLGDSFINYIEKGMSTEDAYWAVKGREAATKITPPEPPGKANSSDGGEKTFFSREEVKNMSKAEVEKNLDVIMKSQLSW